MQNLVVEVVGPVVACFAFASPFALCSPGVFVVSGAPFPSPRDLDLPGLTFTPTPKIAGGGSIAFFCAHTHKFSVLNTALQYGRNDLDEVHHRLGVL